MNETLNHLLKCRQCGTQFEFYPPGSEIEEIRLRRSVILRQLLACPKCFEAKRPILINIREDLDHVNECPYCKKEVKTYRSDRGSCPSCDAFYHYQYQYLRKEELIVWVKKAEYLDYVDFFVNY
jgi:hypothetical protein